MSAQRWICCRRTGQYFNGSDSRPRIKEMVALATVVDHVECAHDLEAGVRELRLLAAHAPPYNRRSKFPRRWWWIVLTDEAFPRFSAVRAAQAGTACVRRNSPAPSGRSGSRADAVETADLLARFTGLRTCTARIARSAGTGPPARERELSPCPAPRDIPAVEYARGAAAGGGTDRRARGRRVVGGTGPHRRTGRAQPLRDRRTAARPRRRGDRRAVARSAAARAGVGRRTRRGAS